jgi:peptide/nickel transport system substrate-binding protein
MKVGIVVVIVAIILAGIGLYYLSTPPKPEVTLIIGTTDTWPALDPATATGLFGEATSMNIFDTLYRYEPDSVELYPVLATEMMTREAPDRYLVNLRQGIKFHDGTPFNATAVKYSLDRTATIGQAMSWVFTRFIKEVEVVDDYTVRFHLHIPFAPFEHLFPQSALGIVSPTAAEKYGGIDNYEEFDLHNIGSGPFKFVEFIPGDRIVLEANKDYWNPERIPRVDKVIIKFYADSSTLKFALETAEIDIAHRSIAMADVPSLKANPDIDVIDWEWMGYPMNLVFNLNVHPLNNIYVREAIAYAIDYEGIVETALGGQGYRVYSWEPPSWPTYTPAYQRYEYNLTKALELMETAREADPTIPETIELELSNSGIYFGADVPTFVTILQSNLEDIGITASIVTVDQITHRTNRKAGNWEIAIYSWAPQYEDAHYMADSLMHPSGSLMGPNGYNMSTYDAVINPIHPEECRALVEQGVAEQNLTKRIEIYHQIQNYGAEDLPHIWVYTRDNYVFAREYVDGLIAGPNRSSTDLAIISKEDTSAASFSIELGVIALSLTFASCSMRAYNKRVHIPSRKR